MKRVMYAAVAVLGCTVAASAQGGGADMKAPDKMAKDDMKTVMVSGCVAEADGKYTLNHAMMMDKAAPAAGAPAMAAPSMAAPAMAPMSYSLTGGTLKPHVGHKVEITGTMKPAAKGMMAKEGMAKSADKPAMGDMKKEATAGTLDVQALKMVSATCS
ncbi:MAG: hypothetical protein ABI818_11615 [Acidobacteriota bacterium]